MTGIVQTSSEATRSWSSSPLIVSRDSFSHQTWARFQPGGAKPALFGCHYIFFLLYHIYHLCFTCIDFYDLSDWSDCWFDVYIRRFIYKFLNVCPFDYAAVAGSGKVGSLNQVNHTNWVAVVTPTDRPKSVRNRCLIELFCGVVCVFTLPFWHFRGCRGFCHRTESDLLLFVFASLLVSPMLGCRHSMLRLSNISRFYQVECTFSNISTCEHLPVGDIGVKYKSCSAGTSICWSLNKVNSCTFLVMYEGYSEIIETVLVFW